MDVYAIVLEFSNFLNNSYSPIYELGKKVEKQEHDLMLADKIENGFLQFIWEIMVDMQLCKGNTSLEPYDNGADFEEKSSRVTYPSKTATHKVVVDVSNQFDYLSETSIGESTFDFIMLVNFKNSEYQVIAPFDFVLCDDDYGKKYIFKLTEIKLRSVLLSEEQIFK